MSPFMAVTKTRGRAGLTWAVAALASSAALMPSAARAQRSAGSDYLSPELRARVQWLRAEIRREPTTLATLRERTEVLWPWANAFSLQGGVLPVELPLIAGLVFSREGNFGGIPIDPPTAIDRFTRELEVKEANPRAVGELTSSAAEPMVARSYQTITQTWTVGEMGMAVGGGVLLARHFMSDHGFPYQTDQPAADNYVTLRCSNPRARFVPDTESLAGMHGGFRTTLDTLAFRLEAGPLVAGDRVEVTYGDRSGGSRGFRIQSYSNDRFPLPIYVDLEGEGNYFTLPIFPHRVVGGPAAGVHGFAPSVVAVGERFEVSIRTEDAYYNRASGPIPAYEITVNGRPFRSLAAGGPAIALLADVAFDAAGVYRFEIASADGVIRGVANPILVGAQPAERIFWGETHGHCGFAEGQGTPEGFFEFGRDDARLDFLTLSEHDLWLDDAEWARLLELTRRYHREGSFITFAGHEWTQDTVRGGHHNVFFRTPEGRRRANVQRAPMLSDLFQTLRSENDLKDVLIIPHAHEAGEWRLTDPELARLVEIMSMHGTFEWYGRAFLAQGYQMGFIAASDDHLSHPGYSGTLIRGLFQPGGLAAVVAPEKTNDAIFDALRGLSTYATTGERPILRFNLNGAAMGRRVPFDPERRLAGRAIGASPIDTITIFKNGRPLRDFDYLTARDRLTSTYLLSFWSESDPLKRDNPRAIKTWSGTVTIHGARLKRAQFPRRHNVYSEQLNVSPADGRIGFTVMTRGRDRSILLELDGARPETTVEITLDPGAEMQPGTAIYRVLEPLPGSTRSVRLSDLKAGRGSLEYPVRRYVDTITLRAIDPSASMDREFEWVDHVPTAAAVGPPGENETPTGEGDYYFIRMTELSGTMAWSSPVWVGGFRPR